MYVSSCFNLGFYKLQTMKKLTVLLLLIPLLSFGQSQILNGITLNGPQGFEKTGEFTWNKGNDLINVMSINTFMSQDSYVEECKKGTRTTEYLLTEKVELSGKEYSICIQVGENDFLIGQAVVYRDGYSYIVTVATYPGDYESSEMIAKSYEQIGYMMGYMITRIISF